MQLKYRQIIQNPNRKPSHILSEKEKYIHTKLQCICYLFFAYLHLFVECSSSTSFFFISLAKFQQNKWSRWQFIRKCTSNICIYSKQRETHSQMTIHFCWKEKKKPWTVALKFGKYIPLFVDFVSNLTVSNATKKKNLNKRRTYLNSTLSKILCGFCAEFVKKMLIAWILCSLCD